MTLAQFEALLDRHDAQRRHEKLCAGTIAAAVYNVHLKEDADWQTAGHIFPELAAPEPTDEEKMEQCIGFFEGLHELSKVEQQRKVS